MYVCAPERACVRVRVCASFCASARASKRVRACACVRLSERASERMRARTYAHARLHACRPQRHDRGSGPLHVCVRARARARVNELCTSLCVLVRARVRL